MGSVMDRSFSLKVLGCKGIGPPEGRTPCLQTSRAFHDGAKYTKVCFAW